MRQRLLDAMAEVIAHEGFHRASVAEVVRRAKTSRRSFYEHFKDRDECYLQLLDQANERLVAAIVHAIDPTQPWRTQVAQAITAWIEASEDSLALTLAWVRDTPSVGVRARAQQRTGMESFLAMIRTLTEQSAAAREEIAPVSRERAIVLVGGLRELIATQVEDGLPLRDIVPTSIILTEAILLAPAVPVERDAPTRGDRAGE